MEGNDWFEKNKFQSVFHTHLVVQTRVFQWFPYASRQGGGGGGHGRVLYGGGGGMTPSSVPLYGGGGGN